MFDPENFVLSYFKKKKTHLVPLIRSNDINLVQIFFATFYKSIYLESR
jgi:hypothetical protein